LWISVLRAASNSDLSYGLSGEREREGRIARQVQASESSLKQLALRKQFKVGWTESACLLAMSVWKDEETASLAQSYGAVKLLDKGQLASTLFPAIEEYTLHNDKAHHA